MQFAKHVGRVGSLAVALGVGIAVASSPGVASATPDAATDGGSATDSSGAASAPATSTTTKTKTLSEHPTPQSAATETDSSSTDARKPSGTPTTSHPSSRRARLANGPEVGDSDPPAVSVESDSGGAEQAGEQSSTPSDPADTHDDDVPDVAPPSADPPAHHDFTPPDPSAARGKADPGGANQVGEQSFTPGGASAAHVPLVRRAALPSFDPPAVSVVTESVGANQADAQYLSKDIPPAAAQPLATTAPPAVPRLNAFLNVPATIVATVTGVVRSVLGAFGVPLPGAPSDSPLGWTVLAIVRRELFNATPEITSTSSKPDASGNITVSLNTTDGDGDLLSYKVSDGAKGTVVLNADGHTLTYTPNPGATGQDSFVVTATDATNAHIHGISGLINALSFGLIGDAGHTTSTTVTVTLNTPPTLTAAAGAPDPANGKVTVTLVVKDADGDPPIFSLSTPANGGVTAPVLVDAAKGTYAVVYTPTDDARHAAAADTATDAQKFDTFNVSISDGHGGSTSVPVKVDVAPANTAPTFATFTPTTDSAGKVTGTITFADADNGDKVIYSGSTTTSKGAVDVKPDGTVTYTPTKDARFVAAATDGVDSDTFTITAKDDHGGTSTHDITVIITPATQAELTADPTTALAAAQSAITSGLEARDTANAEFAAQVSATGASLTADQVAAILAGLTALNASPGDTMAATITKALEDSLGTLTPEELADLQASAKKIRAAENSLSRPINLAAGARASVQGASQGDGAPVLAKIENYKVTYTDTGTLAGYKVVATGDLVFVNPNNDPVLLVNLVPDNQGITVSGTGKFTYQPPPTTTPPSSVTFFVVALNSTGSSITKVVLDVRPPASAADLATYEKSLAAINSELTQAALDRQDALKTDPKGTSGDVARAEATIAALVKKGDDLNAAFLAAQRTATSV